ncbi:MAG: large subunit ribosomal protein L24 [Planctomycetota bacterium]|jgi:large subunit ribosomal protein L24
MKIKKGDKVIITTGKDKGRKGTVLVSRPNTGSIIVEGSNMKTKHVKAYGGNAGQLVRKPFPIDVSNVMLIDPKTDAPTRVGYKMVSGKKVRYAKKSGNEV